MNQQERVMTMYGCDIDQFIESVEASLTFRLSGPGMIVMSMMSDCQEMMALGGEKRLEEARQTLNRAKYMIHHYRLGLKERDGL